MEGGREGGRDRSGGKNVLFCKLQIKFVKLYVHLHTSSKHTLIIHLVVMNIHMYRIGSIFGRIKIILVNC